MEEEDSKIPRIVEEEDVHGGSDLKEVGESKKKLKTKKKKKKYYWMGCLRAESDESGNVDLTVDFPGERTEPTHLVVMVNGLIGRFLCCCVFDCIRFEAVLDYVLWLLQCSELEICS